MYVVIEGVDTCGKSTQIGLLREVYPQAVFTKEPGGTALGAKIRELVLTDSTHGALDERAEALLFLADRAQHYTQLLQAHATRLIISDRSLISGIAYARHIPLAESIALNRFALRGLLPDLAIILELDESSLRARLGAKLHDNIERRGIGYLLEIQSRLMLVAQELGVATLTLNAAQSRDAISREIQSAIDSKQAR